MRKTAAGEAIQRAELKISSTTRWRIIWFAIVLFGAALRLARLSWQPLWWDEGYSIFFATEPLPTMLSLTAQDIHPPLYYTLLHLWFQWNGNSTAETARLLSVWIGIATLPAMTWASLSLFPARRTLALVATLLLAISPMHIYYSQEVRMYALAMLLTLAATACLWQIENALAQDRRPHAYAAAYVILGSLALLTLYYTGFLLLAHQLYWLVKHRKSRNQWRWSVLPAIAILLMQLPWWFYALPKLIDYVANKVLSDQDTPLPLWSYAWRHWVAFVSGHLPVPATWLESIRQLAAALFLALLVWRTIALRRLATRPKLAWLLYLIAVPLLTGFLVNLRFPFFPEGGERLQLQTLPYLLLLVTITVASLHGAQRIATAALATLITVSAALGSINFFTMPRYVVHDYRPLIADVVKAGRDGDSVLALFPWQVGYWRAYAPRDSSGALLQPQPAPVDQTILEWDQSFAQRLDSTLSGATVSGATLWFPMPLSLGSTLPLEIEDYLETHARNVENRWYSDATRLTAWIALETPLEPKAMNATFTQGPTLHSATLITNTVTSDNSPLALDLCWQPAMPRDDLRTTIRLIDHTGYTWASRDLTPLANYAGLTLGDECLEKVALLVPAGLPPDSYTVALGVGPVDSIQLLPTEQEGATLVPIGQVQVASPAHAVSPYRLAIAEWLDSSPEAQTLQLLGHSGINKKTMLLAGDQASIDLYLQNRAPVAPHRELYVSLLDPDGNGVAGWEGWPFPNYPTEMMAQDALLKVPVTFFLPPNLSEGTYSLIAGFIDPANGVKDHGATLTPVQIHRRPAHFTLPAQQYTIDPPATFGTHAALVGYNVTHTADTLHLELTWHVLKPLLPPHTIFVHLYDEQGTRITQSDDEPVTGTERAPTGSWLPGEYLTTTHTLILPPGTATVDHARIGLYLPESGARLPVTQGGVVTGDSVTILLPVPP